MKRKTKVEKPASPSKSILATSEDPWEEWRLRMIKDCDENRDVLLRAGSEFMPETMPTLLQWNAEARQRYVDMQNPDKPQKYNLELPKADSLIAKKHWDNSISSFLQDHLN